MCHPTAAVESVLRRSDLLALGLRPKGITRAVRAGRVIRLRRDRYVMASGGDVEQAVRVGGRLACVSLLALLGVFVFETSRVHIHLDRSMSRLRSPRDRRRPLRTRDRKDVRLHWSSLQGSSESLGVVGLADALAQAVRCQDARSAVATVDSVLHLGLMSLFEVREVFSWLPSRYAAILKLVDPSAESGTESLTRLILRQLGLRFETQKEIPGVGRVDFLVEGWLIVECDSKQFHEGWAQQRRDRKRDLAAAKLGYATLRLLAEDVLYERAEVVAGLRRLATPANGRRRNA